MWIQEGGLGENGLCYAYEMYSPFTAVKIGIFRRALAQMAQLKDSEDARKEMPRLLEPLLVDSFVDRSLLCCAYAHVANVK